MKKSLLIALIFSLVLPFACKKEEPNQEPSAPLTVSKCAKYAASVYKDKERTAWLATLSKTEIVDMISKEIITNNKGAVAEVALVKLSDGTEGYLETKHLADKTIVFSQDTKAYQRNNTGSKITATVAAGTLGFVIDGKAEWLQVYIGQVDGQWLTQIWVNEGYSTEADLIGDGRLFEEAVTVLRNKESKSADRDKAVKKLEGLQKSALLAEKAEAALAKFQQASEEE